MALANPIIRQCGYVTVDPLYLPVYVSEASIQVQTNQEDHFSQFTKEENTSLSSLQYGFLHVWLGLPTASKVLEKNK